MKSISIERINNLLKGEIIGSTNQQITSPEQIEIAQKNQITFIGHKKYEKFWETSYASIAVVNEDISIEPGENRAFIKVKNADLAMSQVLELFIPSAPIFHQEIHSSATIDKSVKIGKGTKIGANCYIGPNVEIGENCILYPNVTILDECKIGNETTIWSGSVIRERSKIGNQCLIHPNVTIGADGFGFRPCPEKGLVKIPHIGNVIIGNQVEIGANTCIDRGKFSSTSIGDGCKIDNLVQIGHNSKMGRFCIIAGNSGLAGSVTLGNGVMIGGGASLKDHISVGDGAIIGGGSGVTTDVPAKVSVVGYPAVEVRTALKQWAILKRLATSK